jgi:hypothetical protein
VVAFSSPSRLAALTALVGSLWRLLVLALADLSLAPPEQVFASEVQKLREDKFFPKEQLTLGVYLPHRHIDPEP